MDKIIDYAYTKGLLIFSIFGYGICIKNLKTEKEFPKEVWKEIPYFDISNIRFTYLSKTSSKQMQEYKEYVKLDKYVYRLNDKGEPVLVKVEPTYWNGQRVEFINS